MSVLTLQTKSCLAYLFREAKTLTRNVVKKNQFQVNNMQFEEKVDADPENRMFRVRSTCRKGPAITYICQAETTDQRNRWTGTMSRQLQTQKEFLQALSQPIAYHIKLMKEL